MTNSIASQLQAIKSLIVADTDAPQRRPFTRPSILFNTKEAADIDVESILRIALSGLEVLIGIDKRFDKYRNDLFSFKSRDLGRELMGIEENELINGSICSYLTLLSGHFELPSALKTLEYLIRRYKVHVYNIEELILCALPYHDTHAFVRIVQLVDTGNSKWRFLDGVKLSGAPPPRKVIVQQCVRDLGILETLCNNALPSKKFQPSRPVRSFSTAVVIELLGSIAVVDTNVVKRILPFVVSGLQSDVKGDPDHKAGALMIVSLLASKVALSHDLVKSLIRSVAATAREDAKEAYDLQWLRLSILALINLVQSQAVEMLPKKVVDALKVIRNLSGTLAGLAMEFNIDKFLAVLLESLIEYSLADDLCHCTLLSIIETIPMKGFVGHVVSKLLHNCMRLTMTTKDSASLDSGSRAKQVLISINRRLPNELLGAIHRFLEDSKVQSLKDGTMFEVMCQMLDGSQDSSISDSKIWFALEHPEAMVRCATLSGLDTAGVLKNKAVDSQRYATIQDAILRRLHDDDLSVVQAALNLDGLPEFINSSSLLDALHYVLQRCICYLISRSSYNSSLAADVALFSLELALSNFKDRDDYAKELASIVFHLILIIPKTLSLNLKALSSINEVKWPFYANLVSFNTQKKTLKLGDISSINLENINRLTEAFSKNPDEYMNWLVECCNFSDLSKTLFFLVLFQSFMMPKIGISQLCTLYDSCFPVLKTQWEVLKSQCNVDEFGTLMLECDCKAFLDHLSDNAIWNDLNAKILICLFWKLSEAFITIAPEDVVSVDENLKWVCRLQDLFVFFASQSDPVFKKHLNYFVTKCKISPVRFLSKLFTETGVSVAVQVGSLHAFALLCSQSDESLLLQLLTEFPCVLVPLFDDNQDIRLVAMRCIEGLLEVWSRVNLSRSKNGKSAVWSHFLGELLGLMIQQKRLIVSDRNILPSFFTALLSSSCHTLLVPETIGQRFDKSVKDDILNFLLGSALKLSSYGKLRILSLLKGVGSRVILVKDVKLLLTELLKRRHQYHLENDKSCIKLSKIEVEILCLLLECCTMHTSSNGHDCDEQIMKALQLDGTFSEDGAVVQPCLTVLRSISTSWFRALKTETQESFFRILVILFQSANVDIHNSTREALMRINVTCSTVGRMLDLVLKKEGFLTDSAHGKKKKKSLKHQISELKCGHPLLFLSSLLDILRLKKDIENRASILLPLFKLLHVIYMDDEWIKGDDHNENYVQASPGSSRAISVTLRYVQQSLLLILEDISSSLDTCASQQDELFHNSNVELLVQCARISRDAVTRNHVLSLLSTIAKVVPETVLDHMLDILTIIGESAVAQLDSHSQQVFENLIHVLIPYWLSKTGNIEELLQVFVNVLPEVAEHRRLSIIVHLLRTLGEHGSLAPLVLLLFRSMVSRKSFFILDDGLSLDAIVPLIRTQWEYVFALQISEQYSCMIWLPSLVKLLQQIETGVWDKELFMELLVAIQFISDKLEDPEVSFKLNLVDNADDIQRTVGELMEQIVSHLQLVDSRRKLIGLPSFFSKAIKEHIHTILKSITKGLLPSAYFKVIIRLLDHANGNVKRKALEILCETVKNSGAVQLKRGNGGVVNSARSSWLHLDESARSYFNKLCLEIVKLVNVSDETSNISLKLGAIGALEVLANRFPSNDSVFNICLASVARNIRSDNLAVSCGCLRTTGALINVLGPKALSELPPIMEHLLQKSRDVSSFTGVNPKYDDDKSSTGLSASDESLFMSVLLTLEAVIDKLGGFLNPYIGEILELVVLHSGFANICDPKLKPKADVVRKLITDKIPVRLSLPPLLKIYANATKSGDLSLSITFEMLGNLVGTMDRSSVSAYHTRIFDLCLLALDLRRQKPLSVRSIDVVEKNVIEAMTVLTMKLTETMFKPLFIKTIEWSESNVEESESVGSTNIDRALSFYSLVHKLAESHRSLFVPYFKYLLDGCIRHLTDAEDGKIGLTRKKKKAKLQEVTSIKNDGDGALSIGMWHLRALVLSSLQKCFVYDTGSLKFLDSSNFQALLKPITLQLIAHPPICLEQYPNVPKAEDVDDLLVACVGQMAVNARSDLLWKPLNHEVLMHTRSENIRPRILGLRIVKYFLENLKEEYLVLLPETIPFLGELLEDVELPVKSLAQEILKEMESMSGESLRQYL